MGPKSLKRAGREGYHLQCGALSFLHHYDAGLAEGGHDGSKLNLAVMQSIHLVGAAAEVPAAREGAEQIRQATMEEYSPKGRDLAFVNDDLIRAAGILQQASPGRYAGHGSEGAGGDL